MKSGNLIVKSNHPLRRFIKPAIGVVILLCAWMGYQYGLVQAGYKGAEVSEERDLLNERIDTLLKERKQLNEQLTTLKRTQAIDREAYDEVRDNLKSLQEEILELREEVDFYRGIVSPSERMAGLNIQTFKIEPAGEEHLYHFNLVMTQVLNNDRFVRGVVNVFVQGVQDGEPQSLEFEDISPNKSVTTSFRFRYFQQMEGDVRLPEGFVPRVINVEIAPKGRKKISKSFTWQVVAGEG